MRRAPQHLPARRAGRSLVERRLRSDERGTTLIEVLVSVVLLALLSGAIGALVTVVAGGQRSASDRLDVSTASHQLQRWFTTDVQSADRSVLDDPVAVDRACDGIDAGDRLRIAWGEDRGRHVALYRVRSADTGAELVRVECVDGAVRARTVIATGLVDTGSVVVGADPGRTGSLRLAVALRSPRGVRTVVLSEPVQDRGGAEAVTTTRPGSSGPDACAVRSLTVGDATMPGTATADLAGPVLVGAVPIDLRTVGSCGAMALQVRSASALVATVALAHEPSTDPLTHRDRYRADLPSGPWKAGTYAVQVTDTAAALAGGDGRLVLRRPCWVSHLSVTPTVSATTGGSRRLLSKDVLLEATVDPWCPDLPVTVAPAPPSGVPALVLTGGTSVRTVRVPGGTGPWSPGIYRIAIPSVPGAPEVAFAVGTTPACQVTGLAVVPGTVALRPGAPGTARGLRQGISVSIGTLGACGTVTATVVGTAPVPAPGPYVVGTAPVVIGADPQLAWWPGSYSVRLRSSSATIVGASDASFEVLDGCSASLAPGWSAKDLSSTSSRPLVFSVTTSTACDALTGDVQPAPPGGGAVSLTPSATDGEATVEGAIAKSGGWPGGRYTLTISSGGVPVASTTFDVA